MEKTTTEKIKAILELNKKYFLGTGEAILLIFAFIFTTIDLTNFLFDKKVSLQITFLLIAFVVWLTQFYIKTFILKKYDRGKAKADLIKRRPYPEVAYFLCIYTFLTLLKNQLSQTPLGNNSLSFFHEFTSYALAFTLFIFFPITNLPVLGAVIIMEFQKKHPEMKNLSKFSLLSTFSLLMIVVFSISIVVFNIASKLIFNTQFFSFLVSLIIQTPLIYYFTIIFIGSPLIEKLSGYKD